VLISDNYENENFYNLLNNNTYNANVPHPPAGGHGTCI